MDRRTFVLGTSTAFLSQVAPSDQFNLGVIGSGGRGQLLMRTFAEVAPVRFEGVCDVYEPNLESGLSLAKGSAKAYRNYKALLDNQSIQEKGTS
jgi:predicted dehydrogenase